MLDRENPIWLLPIESKQIITLCLHTKQLALHPPNAINGWVYTKGVALRVWICVSNVICHVCDVIHPFSTGFQTQAIYAKLKYMELLVVSQLHLQRRDKICMYNHIT